MVRAVRRESGQWRLVMKWAEREIDEIVEVTNGLGGPGRDGPAPDVDQKFSDRSR